MKSGEFSFRTRSEALARFKGEIFDLLVIGGGITGAAVARDASSRGLKVALVERQDFAAGTSSRSSKLIHGGLRYLENLEFHLVFEALSERAFLLKTAPHMVRPLPFYLPVYAGDPHGKNILSLGLWLYDLLALFRAPGFHKRLSRKQMLAAIPELKSEGLVGGFRYYDASMWDDMLAVATLRSAVQLGAAVGNYVEAISPILQGEAIRGFRVRDLEPGGGTLDLRARRVVSCVGPWTDELGARLDTSWQTWLSPSQGVHLVFDLKRLPLPGAMVMSHPHDGRISFVIPRTDYGSGVTIVGTTDGPINKTPDQISIQSTDVDYLMALLDRYFPDLKITRADIISAYIGIRPLVKEKGKASLQKVSREHSIERGPAGITLVGGGKYTTHRKMAEEIVNFVIKEWRHDFTNRADEPPLPEDLIESRTDLPVTPQATQGATQAARQGAHGESKVLPEKLWDLFGAEALEVAQLQLELEKSGLWDCPMPEGFPALGGQLVFSIRHGGIVHLEDFYLRRAPLFLARADHGRPWARKLAVVLARELGKDDAWIEAELQRLDAEFGRREAWAKV